MTAHLDGIGMTSRRTRNRLVDRLRSEGIRDSVVLEAVREVPRHLFVDEALASRAYEDSALPIGCGQTISQPLVVAKMTESLLAGRRLNSVLEIGSGCGYQSALLARLVERVYSVERLGSLLQQSRERLYALGIHNVRMRHGDGYEGWAEHAPYDGILVAASAPSVPARLLEQLAPEGRLVMPVAAAEGQELVLVTRNRDRFEQSVLGRVSFVPLLGGSE